MCLISFLCSLFWLSGLFNTLMPCVFVFISGSRFLQPAQVCDLLKGLIMVLCYSMMHYVDYAMMYHLIRGQSVIKLYIIYNMLEVQYHNTHICLLYVYYINSRWMDALCVSPLGGRSLVFIFRSGYFGCLVLDCHWTKREKESSYRSHPTFLHGCSLRLYPSHQFCFKCCIVIFGYK